MAHNSLSHTHSRTSHRVLSAALLRSNGGDLLIDFRFITITHPRNPHTFPASIHFSNPLDIHPAATKQRNAMKKCHNPRVLSRLNGHSERAFDPPAITGTARIHRRHPSLKLLWSERSLESLELALCDLSTTTRDPPPGKLPKPKSRPAPR